MDNASTYGLRLDQMADLFALGAEGPDSAAEPADDETLRALLQEQLACPEPKGSLLRDSLVMMVAEPGPLANRLLGEILLDPQSDPGVPGLRAIKDSSKALSCSLESATEAALARTLYFAAIAAALVRHDTKITEHTYATLAESLTMLIERPWMAAELAELLVQAREICRRRVDAA